VKEKVGDVKKRPNWNIMLITKKINERMKTVEET